MADEIEIICDADREGGMTKKALCLIILANLAFVSDKG
jgi:hypothetical protein